MMVVSNNSNNDYFFKFNVHISIKYLFIMIGLGFVSVTAK